MASIATSSNTILHRIRSCPAVSSSLCTVKYAKPGTITDSSDITSVLLLTPIGHTGASSPTLTPPPSPTQSSATQSHWSYPAPAASISCSLCLTERCFVTLAEESPVVENQQDYAKKQRLQRLKPFILTLDSTGPQPSIGSPLHLAPVAPLRVTFALTSDIAPAPRPHPPPSSLSDLAPAPLISVLTPPSSRTIISSTRHRPVSDTGIDLIRWTFHDQSLGTCTVIETDSYIDEDGVIWNCLAYSRAKHPKAPPEVSKVTEVRTWISRDKNAIAPLPNATMPDVVSAPPSLCPSRIANCSRKSIPRYSPCATCHPAQCGNSVATVAVDYFIEILPIAPPELNLDLNGNPFSYKTATAAKNPDLPSWLRAAAEEITRLLVCVRDPYAHLLPSSSEQIRSP
jgi:hypothetical protein